MIGNLANYILQGTHYNNHCIGCRRILSFSGYSKARKCLGHALTRRPEEEIDAPHLLIDIFYGLCGEMPMVGCSYCNDFLVTQTL